MMTTGIRHILFSSVIALTIPIALSGCTTTTTPYLQQDMADRDLNGIAKDFETGRVLEARKKLEALAASSPANPVYQTLLALSWQHEASKDPQAQELALVGYRTALKLQPSSYWPAMLAGRISFERGQFDEASDFFAQAVLANPDSPEALLALATSAYFAGDIVLANETAKRVTRLETDIAPAWRLVALTSAALNRPAESDAALQTYKALGGKDSSDLRTRSDLLIRTSAMFEDEFIEAPAPDETAPVASQVSVDVTILLSQNTHRDRVGLNLLDGLRLQYGAVAQRSTENLPGPNTFSSQTTFSQALTLPEINWNLNLFNRFGQYYQVAARPSLTAFLGTASEFFVGRTLQIGVRGINSGQIEQVDIGINLKVTPIEIRSDSVIVQIETGRSFVTTDPAGTFAEALSTFRQSVSATAEVRFGETLVLSGLSESVRDATGSKVPGAGDVPVIGSLFNERSTTERRDAVLVFVTPSPPLSFSSKPWMRPEAVQKLVSLWDTVVDPSTNGTDVVARLSRVRMFSRMQPGDAPLDWGPQGEQTRRALSDLLNIN